MSEEPRPQDLPNLRPGCAPFLLDGGDVGCVCVHGFTASPEEMRWLGEYLHARGLTIYAPRLAGHGTNPAQMARQHWHTWYENVLDGIALLRARCETVYAVGLSMGGLLSLRVAAEGLVDGAVIMAAPLYVERRLLRFAGAIKYVKRYINGNKGDLDERVTDIQREIGSDDYGRAAYDCTPVAAAEQLYGLMQDTRQSLPQIAVPLLLLYSKGDQTVPLANLDIVQHNVSSADVVTHVLDHSDHVLTQELERETVYKLVWEFIAARS